MKRHHSTHGHRTHMLDPRSLALVSALRGGGAPMQQAGGPNSMPGGMMPGGMPGGPPPQQGMPPPRPPMPPQGPGAQMPPRPMPPPGGMMR